MTPLPPIVDRTTWQARLDELLVKEKAHTRVGDALAAERRRLPMVEVDPRAPLVGAGGPVPLIDVFEGRSQLIAYFHMWHHGMPAAEQCEGCTYSTTHMTELSYLHSRDITYATICEGPYEESSRYRDFMGWTMPWYSVPDNGSRHRGDGAVVRLMDRTVYGRQELWEDSPEGWPQQWGSRDGSAFRQNGRPTAQWSRIEAGRDDDLGNA